MSGYIKRKWIPVGAVTEDQLDGVTDYLYQVFMRNGTTEHSVMVNLDSNLIAKIAVGQENMLKNKNIPIPISFIYGDRDWVQLIEDDIA